MPMTFSKMLAGLLEALGLIRFDAASQPCFSAELLCGHFSISSDFPAFDRHARFLISRGKLVLRTAVAFVEGHRASFRTVGHRSIGPELVLAGPMSVWPVI
jgi:hypothetical protein